MSAEDRVVHHALLHRISLDDTSRSGLGWGVGLALLALLTLFWPETAAPLPGVSEAAEFVSRPSSLGKGIETGRAGEIAFRLTPDLALNCRFEVFGEPYPEVVQTQGGEIGDAAIARPVDLAHSVASFCRRALEAR